MILPIRAQLEGKSNGKIMQIFADTLEEPPDGFGILYFDIAQAYFIAEEV